MAVGNQTPADLGSDYATLSFIVQQKLSQIATLTLARVVECSVDGAVGLIGEVVVQPLVNMMSGDKKAFPHKPLYKLPYVRIQGGANAIIIDPKPGDLGLVGFASRDISAVKKSKGVANPGSFRQFSMSDGIYIMTCLGTTIPTQYLVMNDDGVTVVSPTEIILRAPLITLDGAVEATGIIHSDVDVIADNISGKSHTHGGVQSGGSNTAGPNP